MEDRLREIPDPPESLNGHPVWSLSSGDQRGRAVRRLRLECVEPDRRRHQQVTDVFVRDRKTATTERVSVGSSGTQANGGGGRSAVSADGRFVAFTSDASNLVAGDRNQRIDAFVRDRNTDTTTLV